MKTAKTLTCILLGSLIGGCWSWQPIQKTQKISVTTIPTNASVWQTSPQGRLQLGYAPGEFEITHQAEVGQFSHWKWIGTALSAGAMIGGIYWATEASGEFGQTAGAVTVITGGATAFLFTLIFNIMGEMRDGAEYVAPVELGASAMGYSDQSIAIDFPATRNQLAFALQTDPKALAKIKEPQPQLISREIQLPKPAKSDPHSIIVAVFDVQDASERLDPKILDQLTTYLTTVVAMLPEYRVIPRDQLRNRLSGMKTEGYKSCYEQSCQIEMGKALSAQKTLSTHLLRIGDKCALTANLYDLKTETAEKAAMVETRCSLEELLDAMKALAQQLSEKN